MRSDIAKHFIAQSRGFLSSDYLPQIERCLAVLSDEDVWWRANQGSNSIGNLLLHLEGGRGRGLQASPAASTSSGIGSKNSMNGNRYRARS